MVKGGQNTGRQSSSVISRTEITRTGADTVTSNNLHNVKSVCEPFDAPIYKDADFIIDKSSQESVEEVKILAQKSARNENDSAEKALDKGEVADGKVSQESKRQPASKVNGQPIIWDNFSDLHDNSNDLDQSEKSQHDDYSDDFGDTVQIDNKPFLASGEILVLNDQEQKQAFKDVRTDLLKSS